MMAPECPHERDVLAAVHTGPEGPLGEEGELRGHLSHCESCRDLAVIVSLLRADRDSALAGVHVPAAGQVWWRAAIRARVDATQAAARPLTWAHGVAAACAAGLVAGILTVTWPTLQDGVVGLIERTAALAPAHFTVAELSTAVVQQTLPLAILAAGVVVAPLALYLALVDERGKH